MADFIGDDVPLPPWLAAVRYREVFYVIEESELLFVKLRKTIHRIYKDIVDAGTAQGK